MAAVVSAISDVVSSASDALADFDDTVRDVATDVATTVNTTIDNALRDPVGTLVTVGTAIYAPSLLPVVQGARVLDDGGSLEDALLAAGATYAGQYVASQVRDYYPSLDGPEYNSPPPWEMGGQTPDAYYASLRDAAEEAQINPLDPTEALPPPAPTINLADALEFDIPKPIDYSKLPARNPSTGEWSIPDGFELPELWEINPPEGLMEALLEKQAESAISLPEIEPPPAPLLESPPAPSVNLADAPEFDILKPIDYSKLPARNPVTGKWTIPDGFEIPDPWKTNPPEGLLDALLEKEAESAIPTAQSGATGSQPVRNVAGQVAGSVTKSAILGQDIDLGKILANAIGNEAVGVAAKEIKDETGGIGGIAESVGDLLGLRDEDSDPITVPPLVDKLITTVVTSSLLGLDPTSPIVNQLSNAILNEGLDLLTGDDVRDVPITSLVKPQEPDVPVAPPAPVTPPPSGIATLPTDTPPATEGGITTIPATGTPSTPAVTTPEVIPPVTVPVTTPVTDSTGGGVGSLDAGSLGQLWSYFSNLSRSGTTTQPTGVIGGIPATTTVLPYGDSTSLPYG